MARPHWFRWFRKTSPAVTPVAATADPHPHGGAQRVAVVAALLARRGCTGVPPAFVQVLADRFTPGEEVQVATYGETDNPDLVLTVATSVRLMQVFTQLIPSISVREHTIREPPVASLPTPSVGDGLRWAEAAWDDGPTPVAAEILRCASGGQSFHTDLGPAVDESHLP